MAKAKKKSAKNGAKSSKKAPSAAQLAARKAFAERFKTGGSGSKSSKKSGGSSKKKTFVRREDQPSTARSKVIRDDAVSTYERAAVVPVEVPKPEPLPASAPKSSEPVKSISMPFYVPPKTGGKVTRQTEAGTSFFI